VAYRRKASLGGVQEAALWAAATAPIALRLCLVRSICAQSQPGIRSEPGGNADALGPAFHDPSFVTDSSVDTKYALACAPSAHQAALKTLRSFVSVSGFRIEKVAALQAVMRVLHQPILIVWGRQDRLVPPDHARILEAKLPRSKTILFDECGHLPQVEQPWQFNAAVLDFLSHAG
jgi:pimeloyl-ACP methyl ester carboxylesterase